MPKFEVTVFFADDDMQGEYAGEIWGASLLDVAREVAETWETHKWYDATLAYKPKGGYGEIFALMAPNGDDRDDFAVYDETMYFCYGHFTL